jgi:hypothetical protein
MLEETQALVSESSPMNVRVLLVTTRGLLARNTGRLAEAVALSEEAIALVQAEGFPPPGILRWQHASALMWSGDLEQANTLHEENLVDALAKGDMYLAAVVVCDLGVIGLLRGDMDRAADRLREAVMYARQFGDALIMAIGLDALAATATAQHRPGDVALFIGAAESMWARSGIAPDSAERIGRPVPTGTTVGDLIGSARAALGDAAFAAAREAGRTLPLDAVLAETFLDDAPQPSSDTELVTNSS